MEILADLEAVEALPDRVLSLALRLRGDAPPMAPGQYICLGAPGDARLPLSLASDPADLPALTLHFQPTPGHSDSAYLLKLLEQGGPLGWICRRASAPSRTLLAPPFYFWEAARALPNSEASCWRSCALGARMARP